MHEQREFTPARDFFARLSKTIGVNATRAMFIGVMKRNAKLETRDARYIYIYLRYRKSPGNIRRKSAIVDLCVCEMNRTRYWQQTAIYRSAKISARVYPNYSQSEIRELFPTMNEMSRRGLPRVYVYIYIYVPGVLHWSRR